VVEALRDLADEPVGILRLGYVGVDLQRLGCTDVGDGISKAAVKVIIGSFGRSSVRGADCERSKINRRPDDGKYGRMRVRQLSQVKHLELTRLQD
jgi:hypothetical protein